MSLRAPYVIALALVLLVSGLMGCPRFPEEIEIEKGDTIIVEGPPTFADAGSVLGPTATIIADVSLIPIEVLPDVTVLTFENLTGVDIVISYFAEGFPEAVLVPDFTFVSIEYVPCLLDVQLDFEDDYHPVTGSYLGSFDLSDILLIEGLDYFCGDEILFTFDPDFVFVDVFPL